MDRLELRVQRLERHNRLLLATLVGVVSLAALGWRKAGPPDVLQAHRIEVVDAHGVPFAVLDTGRGGEGGSLTLRDREGERRAWFSAAPGSANLGLQGGKADAPSAGVGLAATTGRARISVTGGRAVASTSVDAERPKIELTDSEGRSVFTAPWRR